MRKTLLISLAIASSAFAGVAFAERAVNTTGTAEQQKAEWKNRQQSMTQVKLQSAEEGNGWLEAWTAKKDKIRADAEKKKEAFKLKKERLSEEKCLRVQEKIQNKEGNLEQAKEKHMSVYENMTARIQKFIDRFKAAGLDTSKIEGDLATLKSKIEEFKAAFASYSSKFEGSKLAACGDTEGGLRGKLVDARAEMKITHDIAADIREYMRTTILVDLRELKAQMPQDEDGSETEAEGAGASKNKEKSKNVPTETTAENTSVTTSVN